MKSIILLFALLLAPMLSAQTVSPVVVECGRKCSGEFSVTNNGLTPFISSVVYTGFTPTATVGHASPLAASVKLDSMSARVGPKASHTFFYNISCNTLPCAVRFLASEITGRTKEGLAVNIVISHVVYVCGRAKDCRKNILAANGVK